MGFCATFENMLFTLFVIRLSNNPINGVSHRADTQNRVQGSLAIGRPVLGAFSD